MLKIRIEIIDSIQEDEVIIRCRELSGTVTDIQNAIIEKSAKVPGIVFYKDKDEYYFPLSDVLFFESGDDTVFAHTSSDAYKIGFKLYELVRMLPGDFVRISKSAIVNTAHIMSITKSIASSSLVRFRKSHKQIYVSRLYYKELKQKLTERKN